MSAITSKADINNEIILQLESKAREIKSYAQDYKINGLLVKRMYFQFEKNGLPFYRFREDLIRSPSSQAEPLSCTGTIQITRTRDKVDFFNKLF